MRYIYTTRHTSQNLSGDSPPRNSKQYITMESLSLLKFIEVEDLDPKAVSHRQVETSDGESFESIAIHSKSKKYAYQDSEGNTKYTEWCQLACGKKTAEALKAKGQAFGIDWLIANAGEVEIIKATTKSGKQQYTVFIKDEKAVAFAAAIEALRALEAMKSQVQ